MATAADVVKAIFSVTADTRTRMAMLMGARLESGWSTEEVGDNGQSYGPFQIYLVAHPNVTAAQAKDPYWASRFMLPAYQQGVAKVSDAQWQANPANAAALAAFYAERPAEMYPSDRVSSAWGAVSGAMNGAPVGVGGGGVTPVAGGIPVISDVAQSISNFGDWIADAFADFYNHIYYALLFIGGGAMMAMGLYLLFHDAASFRDAFSKITTIGGRV